MKLGFVTLAGLPLLALAQPAAAQDVSTGSYRNTLDFAECAVKANPADAKALLATAPDSAEEKGLVKKLASTAGCTGKVNEKALRGAIAERVYVASYTGAPTEPTGPAAPFTGSGKPELVNWDVTRCAVSRDPVGADMLVRSELGSAGQKEAVARLGPVLGGCLPAGAKLGFDRERMRGLIAEGLIVVRAGAGAQ